MLQFILNRGSTCIDQTICIHLRLNEHNTGYVSSWTKPFYLYHFAIMAYIYEFDGGWLLHGFVEQQWKSEHDHLITMGNYNPKAWTGCGRNLLNIINEQIFSIEGSKLRLILLFKYTYLK